MFGFSPEFQTGKAKITQIRLSVLLADNTLLSLTEENVLLGGFVRDSSTTIDSKFTIGAAVTGKLTVNIDNTEDTFSRYDFRRAIITAKLGGQLTDGTYQLVQVGIYTVDEYIYDGANITLTAYDNLYKFDIPCSGTAVTFPKTVTDLVDLACLTAGVMLANTSIQNGSYSVTKQPRQWDTMTWHDVISYCAQIAGCYAKILPDGRLFLSWYDTSLYNSLQLDGGTFSTTTTPYSDGGVLDGGDFDYNDSTVFDGGVFGDRDNTHIIGSINELTISTDDVLISGVSVLLATVNNINATKDTQDYTKTLGTAGYIINIENNPLIETTTDADSVCAYLYDLVVGMRFRPLDTQITENPDIEAGDDAIVIDRRDNTYICFISHAVYTTGAATSISCDAESPRLTLKARYSEAEKTRALAQYTFERAVLDADSAMQMILSAYATTMGLYQYTESDGHGGTIYTYGNKNTLAASNIRWRFSAGALMVSSDYGAHWNAAISSEGIAVFQEVYAVKVNADNIVAGTITGRTISGGTINGANVAIGGSQYDGELIIKDANNNVLISMDKSGISINKGLINGGKIVGSFFHLVHSNTSQLVDTSQFLFDSQIIGYSENYANTVATVISGDYSYHIGNGNVQNSNNTTVCVYPYGIYIGRGFYNTTQGYYHLYNNILTINRAGDSTHDSVVFNYTPLLPSGSSQYNNLYFGYERYNGEFLSAPYFSGDVYAVNLTCFGSKNKAIDTENYGTKLAYCYEMPSPMYGDIGGAIIGSDGFVVVDIDPIFQEYIYEKGEYYVFLQNEGNGESYIYEKNPTYFIIAGTPNLKVAWEMKAKQVDSFWKRSETMNAEVEGRFEPDYIEEAQNSVMEYLDSE